MIGSIIRYRKWKYWAGPPLASLGLWLMRGEPDDSRRWTSGAILALLMVLFYVGEELIWMSVGKGRPCRHCHQMVRVKPFRLALKCEHCGKTFD